VGVDPFLTSIGHYRTLQAALEGVRDATQSGVDVY
jgi:hypothetical protein